MAPGDHPPPSAPCTQWVFSRTFLFDAAGHLVDLRAAVAAWDRDEWVAVSTNLILVVFMALTRIGWLAVAKPAKAKSA